MKHNASVLLISSLLAATAMSVPAFGSDDGTLAGTAKSLVWSGGDTGAWNYSTENTSWTVSGETEQVSFTSGDNATFSSDASITIDAAGITAGTLTVSEGASVALSGGTVSVSSLSVAGALTLDSSATLAVTSFASSIAQNSTVDYSKLNGTGTLTLGLRNDNGIGFNLQNFEGTIRVERGSGLKTAGRLQLDTSTLNANAKLVVAAGNDLVFNGEGTNISNTITFEGDSIIHANQYKNGTLSGNITATGTLTKKGAGTLTFGGAGTTTIGTFNYLAGELVFASSGKTTINNFKTTGISSAITINSGTTLDVGTWNQAYTVSTLTINGDLNISKEMILSTGGEVNNITGTGNLTVEKLTTGNAGKSYSFSGINLKIGSGGISGTQSLSFGKMTIGVKDTATSWTSTRGFTLSSTDGTTFNPSKKTQSIEVQGVINGDGKLVKTGAGTLKLSGANTFTGGMTISEGTLIANNASALGTGKVAVDSGAKLGLVADVTISGVTGGVEFADGAKIVIDMSSKISATESFVLDLITETALKYGDTDITSANANSILHDAVEFSNWGSGWTWELVFDEATKKLSLKLVPEPSTFGLLAGVGALALVAARRRRRAK